MVLRVAASIHQYHVSRPMNRRILSTVDTVILPCGLEVEWLELVVEGDIRNIGLCVEHINISKWLIHVDKNMFNSNVMMMFNPLRKKCSVFLAFDRCT